VRSHPARSRSVGRSTWVGTTSLSHLTASSSASVIAESSSTSIRGPARSLRAHRRQRRRRRRRSLCYAHRRLARRPPRRARQRGRRHRPHLRSRPMERGRALREASRREEPLLLGRLADARRRAPGRFPAYVVDRLTSDRSSKCRDRGIVVHGRWTRDGAATMVKPSEERWAPAVLPETARAAAHATRHSRASARPLAGGRPCA
jgi:hypothetical protein